MEGSKEAYTTNPVKYLCNMADIHKNQTSALAPTIDLALAFDKGYLTPINVLLTSVFINNKEVKISIHCIATGLDSGEQQALIEYVETHGHNLTFYSIDSKTISSISIPNHATSSPPQYYRLLFASLVPQNVKRILYIDGDVLVVGNLLPLFNANIGLYPIGAVIDVGVPVRSDIGIYSRDDYFNSGVLLIDRDKWLEQEITEKCIVVIKEQPEKIRYADQDVLNMVLKNNWCKLDNRFNIMPLYVPYEVPKRDFDSFLADKVIVHFSGKKPWKVDCDHRLRHLYHYYLKLSPKAGEKAYHKADLNRKQLGWLLYSRLVEMYFDHPGIVSLWRKLKS